MMPQHRHEAPTAKLSPFTLDRMERAVEKVRERLERATSALGRAEIAYAVAGGHAVAAWVSQVDEAATRTTRDVDLLVRRPDLELIKVALGGAGFVYRHSSGLDLFLDGPDAKARDAVQLIFAGEKVRPDEPLSNPEVADSEVAGSMRVLSLPALVQIKLTAFRDKDRTHLRDLIDVGLIDETWPDRYPPELAQRLRGILETPEG
jgi:hypothetical protein